MTSSSVPSILALLAQPVSGNPTQYLIEKAFAHHDLDDPRVPYTRGYCEKVFAERDRRSLPIPGQRTVIVNGQPVKQVP